MPESEDRSPRRVVEHLLAGVGAGPSSALADLYADDTIVELPFAGHGGLRLVGREQVAQHFENAGRSPLRLAPRAVTLHETADPEVIVAEYDYHVEVAPPEERSWSPTCRSWECGTDASSPRAISTIMRRWRQRSETSSASLVRAYCSLGWGARCFG